ncbi:MAG: ATP-binding cassette domain-containing protein, partial [Xanthobacteraceae bacterium]
MHSVETTKVFAPVTEPSSRPLLRIESLTKRFGRSTVVDQLSLDIYEGEFFALLGPSGCGKTTLLRLIAGFERPNAGRIVLDEIDLASVPAYRRPVNMMFQSYALFPHLNVQANVAFGLKQERLPRREIAYRLAHILALVKLDGLAKRRPHELSGGQRQRVAIARVILKNAPILVLDEATSALDSEVEGAIQASLDTLMAGKTVIAIAHRLSTIARMDRLVILD